MLDDLIVFLNSHITDQLKFGLLKQKIVVTDISLLMQWWLPAIADCISLAIRCSSYHALVFVVTPNSHLKSVDHDHYNNSCVLDAF